MRHILASRDDWHRNILLPEVAAYIEERKAESERQGKPYPLHRYIHHGLSSQALLFNLIGPLIVRDDLEPLKVSIERTGLAWPEGSIRAAFEFEDRDAFWEYQGQPTSIDLVIGREGETPGIFIESKFVEKEFGGCSLFEKGDCDARSPTFAYQDRNTNRGLVPFLLSLTPGRLHAKIKVVYIQEVVAAIRESGRHEWIGEFERKYGLG